MLSHPAVYYQVRQTGLSTDVILATGTSKRYAADISKKNVLVGFTRKSLFLVDMPSNSLAPLEVIQNIADQIFILLSI